MATKYSKQLGIGQFMTLGGQIIFDDQETSAAYQVLVGEVLILRNGQMIDLVQEGELLDASIWDGATAVAWTDCTLQKVPQQSRSNVPFISFDAIPMRLQQLATSTN